MNHPMMWTIPLGNKRFNFYEDSEELYMESYGVQDVSVNLTNEEAPMLLVKEVIKLEQENKNLRDRVFALEMLSLTGGE